MKINLTINCIICLLFLAGFQVKSQILEPLKATLVLDAKTILGEGAIWHPKEKKLYWIDIEGKNLHIFNPTTKEDVLIALGSRVGTVVPVKSGGVLVALQSGIHKLNIKTGILQLLKNPLPDTVSLRFNDGKCDPSGRFWVGTMALDARKKGAVLWRIDKDKSVHLMLDSVTISNGIVWTADKKKCIITIRQQVRFKGSIMTTKQVILAIDGYRLLSPEATERLMA